MHSANDTYTSIRQVLHRMMKVSDNLYAESMFYQLAASGGTRWAGAKSARQYENALFSRIGLNPRDYNVADGSGLSLYNYVSAELETKLLRYAYQRSDIYGAYLEAQPISWCRRNFEEPNAWYGSSWQRTCKDWYGKGCQLTCGLSHCFQRSSTLFLYY